MLRSGPWPISRGWGGDVGGGDCLAKTDTRFSTMDSSARQPCAQSARLSSCGHTIWDGWKEAPLNKENHPQARGLQTPPSPRAQRERGSREVWPCLSRPCGLASRWAPSKPVSLQNQAPRWGAHAKAGTGPSPESPVLRPADASEDPVSAWFEGGPASQSWQDTPWSKGLLGTEPDWEHFWGPRLELAGMPIY